MRNRIDTHYNIEKGSRGKHSDPHRVFCFEMINFVHLLSLRPIPLLTIIALFLLTTTTTATAATLLTFNPHQRPLTMNEMFGQLDDIANIMNDEFKQRREASLTREKDCHQRGVTLRVDEGGIRERANSTRTGLVQVNVETRAILQEQNDLSLVTNTLTTKITTVGNELRDTENDIVDAERLTEGNANTYQSHKEKHEKNVAIVNELIDYLQKGTPGGDVLSTEGDAGSAGDADADSSLPRTTPALRPPPTTAFAETTNAGDGGAATGEADSVKEKTASTHSPIKLTLLLNDIKQSMSDFAPQRDMSHEQLKSSHNQLLRTLESKLSRLQTALQELQSEKMKISLQLQNSILKIQQIGSKSAVLEKSLVKDKLHLITIQQHIQKHEKMCGMMEIKFNELRTLMMADLGMIKEIKNMLGKHQLQRVQLVAENLAEDLEVNTTNDVAVL